MPPKNEASGGDLTSQQTPDVEENQEKIVVDSSTAAAILDPKV